MISTRQIQYALAVERSLNFRRAAEDCAVSQSALSTAILELEKQFGAAIFERNNKRVLVTPVGRQFLDRAREIRLRLNDLEQLAVSQQEPLSMPLSLGAIPTIGPYLLPRVLPKLRTEFPALRMQLMEAQSATLVEQVRDGEIDAAILALPYPVSGLLSFEFWSENFLWVVHREDRHAARNSVRARDLRESGLMLLEDGHCLKDQALAVCKLDDRDPALQFSSVSLSTLVQMTAGRMGSTLIPEIAADQMLAGSEELCAVPLAEPGPHRRFAFIIRPGYPRLPDIELMAQRFQETLQQEAKQR